ncbi:DUF6531 domain-containing protein [Streptomyces sp. NPDC050982]|uniref:DUF6531 domain-containing protein n=1 Tax=Streptomyces sp. NPDC050982 TaxID=3154746 RepID=UPI0034062F83
MAAVPEPPIRNVSLTAAAVYSHSGEFAPTYTDLRLPGRGIDFTVDRSYRSSLAGVIGLFGCGWTSGLDRRIQAADDAFLHHDATGRTQVFTLAPELGWTSPPGCYAELRVGRGGPELRERHGRSARFNPVVSGGRLRVLEDGNGNELRFEYAPDAIFITDALGRPVRVTLADGLVTEVVDFTGRRWTYTYDDDALLVEVVRPATADVPGGSAVRYGYDAAHRLVTITDARGRTYLENCYNGEGRVVEQRHGAGTAVLTYEDTETGVRTTCRSATGGVVVLLHDGRGHLVSRIVKVRRDAFSAEDLPPRAGATIPLLTTFVLNRHSEVVARTDPAGGPTTWTFTENDPDPRNRGNLMRIVRTPQPDVPADQGTLVTSIEVERQFQRTIAITDPRGSTTRHTYDRRGNRTATTYPTLTLQPVAVGDVPPARVTTTPGESFAVNAAGQPLRTTHLDGTVTTYAYHSPDDPCGVTGVPPIDDPNGRGGYLARVTVDAAGTAVTTAYTYDAAGRQVRVVDPAGNAAELEWSPAGQVEKIRGRVPSHSLQQHYDAAGNLVTLVRPFTRLVHNEATDTVTPQAGTLTERREYDEVDRLVARTIEADGTSATERVARDTDGRVTRHMQPEGGITQYVHDERDLMVACIRGAGTSEASTERFTWTPDGSLRSRTDACGETTTWTYDGFGRCIGAVDAVGTTWTRRLDAAGDMVLLTVASAESGGPKLVRETAYCRDEWGRPFRVDDAWRDPEGRALGRSGWDGTEGIVSSLVEYGEDGRPAAAWSEDGGVVRLAWDGAGRLVGIRTSGGDECTIGHDARGEPTELTYRGPDSNRGQFTLSVRAEYDAMGQLARRQVGDTPAETFSYDESGALVDHVHHTGLRIQHLRDSLGRRTGQVWTVPDDSREEPTRIVRQFEYDRNYRLTATVDGAGHRTTYGYDALDRQVSVTRADGAIARAAYDGVGNTLWVVDENGTETVNLSDADGRIVERRSSGKGTDVEVERFNYDGLGRLIGATSDTGTIRWTYDSLSRPLTEERAGRLVSAFYDAAGNTVALAYPGGENVRRRYDRSGRVVAVDTAAGERIARVGYRFGDQVAQLELGGELVAACEYDADQRLSSIEYRRLADRVLVEGFQYHYGAAGLPVEAVRNTPTGESAERYRHDAGGRPKLARYDIEDPADPKSAFGSETAYELLPEGLWARRVDRDGNGATLADRSGDVDDRNRYRRFGDEDLETDATGDVVRRTGPHGTCLYTYDTEHRLVRLECFDPTGQLRLVVAYSYDALSRLVSRTVTDAAGVTTEHAYVWAGDVLLEEYENSVLARTYIHSVGSLPALLRTWRPVRADHLYVHDGRGLVTGLVGLGYPNAFAEKYGYEVTGAPFISEIAGVPVALQDRSTTSSALLNAVLSGVPGVLHDWQTGLLAGLGGRQLDPRIAGALNGISRFTGKSHGGVRDTIAAQVGGMLAMLGLSGRARPPMLHGTGGFRGGTSQYAAGDTPLGGTSLIPSQWQSANPAFDFSGRSPGAAPSQDPPIVRDIKKVLETPVPYTGSTIGNLVGGIVRGLQPGDRTKDAPAAGTNSAGVGGPSQAEKNAQEAADKQKYEQAEKEKAARKADEKAQAEYEKQKKEKEEGDKKKSIVEEGDKYPNPDGSATTMLFRTAAEVERMLNGAKHPVNPNEGSGQPTLDLASPPPGQGGLNPTIAYFDGDAPVGGWAGGSEPTRLTIAPIDIVQGHENPPFTPPDPGAGGGIDPRAHRP